MRPFQFTVTLALLLAAVALAPAAGVAHPEGVSDMPENATAPSDPVLVHRTLEELGLRDVTGAEDEAPGCPAYRSTQGEDDAVASLDPVFEFCATDRMSMFEHSDECRASYAERCIEQVLPRIGTRPSQEEWLRRGERFTLYGVLYRRGQPEASQDLVLERHVLGVDRDFRTFRTQRTATIGEIGSVRMPDVARSVTAYRWALRDDAGNRIRSTVPYLTKVPPSVTSTRFSARTVRRSQRFTVQVTTDVPVYSTVRLEYQHAKRWIQVNRVSVRGSRRITIPGRIHRLSGRVPVRVAIDPMTAPGRPWYNGLDHNVGAMTVLSAWEVG